MNEGRDPSDDVRDGALESTSETSSPDASGASGPWNPGTAEQPGNAAGQPANAAPQAVDPDGGPLSGWVVPDEDAVAPRRRFIRLALVGALGVLAVLLFIAFAGAGQTPLDRATQRAGQQLLADAAFKSKYGSVSREEAFQAGVKLGQDGGGRVDDSTRLALGRSVSRLLALADVETCAGIAKGTVKPEQLLPLIGKFDETSLNEYVDAAVTTTLASVHGDPKKPAPSQAALASAYASWSAAVGGEQRFNEATAVLSTAAGHTSTEICAAERQLFDTAVALPDRDRATVLLVLFLAGGQ
jgi:hypothetical protein